MVQELVKRNLVDHVEPWTQTLQTRSWADLRRLVQSATLGRAIKSFRLLTGTLTTGTQFTTTLLQLLIKEISMAGMLFRTLVYRRQQNIARK